jgi:hypothetical protein
VYMFKGWLNSHEWTFPRPIVRHHRSFKRILCCGFIPAGMSGLMWAGSHGFSVVSCFWRWLAKYRRTVGYRRASSVGSILVFWRHDTLGPFVFSSSSTSRIFSVENMSFNIVSRRMDLNVSSTWSPPVRMATDSACLTQLLTSTCTYIPKNLRCGAVEGFTVRKASTRNRAEPESPRCKQQTVGDRAGERASVLHLREGPQMKTASRPEEKAGGKRTRKGE